ncbi:hypothetical protein K505DRAFT_261318, partial [Melanomma pulvis-pyrius CBS 109.77]
CKFLNKSLYLNIAKYIRCLVKNRRIARLCFCKYRQNVKHNLNKKACLQDIKAEISYLHSLGIVYCNINLKNILAKRAFANKSFVIVDFNLYMLKS